MASNDWLQMRKAAGEETLLRKANDLFVALRFKDIAGGTSTPTVVLSDTSSDITATDSDGNVSTVDLSNASYNTMGEVVDYFNSQAGWECRLLDALRSDASNDVLVDGSVSSSTSSEGETVFDCLVDTSQAAVMRLRVTYSRKTGGLNAMDMGHRVVLKKFQYYADLTAATNIIKIYKCSGPRQTTETQVFSAAGIDIADTEHDLGDGSTPGEGCDYVICVEGTVVNHASGYVQAQYLRE